MKVFRTERYDAKLKKLDKPERSQARNIEESLKKKISGKHLGLGIMEKRIKGKRIIFVTYKNKIILCSITNKKVQQEEIEYIKNKIDDFKELYFN